MTIEHIILPGGGPIGIYVFGALKRLNEINFWKIENIKSIYCTSIGGLIGIITILNLDWNWMDDYLIKRPWNKMLELNNINYLNIISEKGIFDINITKSIIEPLLKSKGLDVNITLDEFYKFTNITLYFYSTNLNSNLLCDEEISYKTYPKLKLYEALYATLNIPFLFKPYFINNKCLIDGGLVNNNPIKSCIRNENCDIDKILFFTNSNENKKSIIEQESNILDLLLLLLSKMATTIMCRNVEFENTLKIKNVIKCDTNNGSLNLQYWLNVLNNMEEREKLLKNGISKANNFINDLSNNIENNDLSNIENDHLSNIIKNDNLSNIKNDNLSNKEFINNDVSNNKLYNL
tara:strand:+ start:1232 stop:2278 length:1047 start_codon:yes stop_codon:yes gene_type:complete